MADSKTLRLMSVLLRNPVEFRDRALMIASSRLSLLAHHQPAYEASDWESVVGRIGAVLNRELDHALKDPELADVESGLRQRLNLLPPQAPFGTFHNGDLLLGRLCYGLVRVLGPACVLETGVCYGITSAFILAALKRNGNGTLYSVDLPPLGNDGDRYVGWAIPSESLKVRWRLVRGLSKKVLPDLLAQIGPVGLFIHDSLHTYGNMRMEFECVWPSIPPGGVLISDDIQGNAAFQDFAQRDDVSFHAVLRELEKKSLLGVIVKQG